MSDLRAFHALRFSAGTDLQKVTAPPYDMIPAAEIEGIQARSSVNIARLTMPVTDPQNPSVDSYEQAASLLNRWIHESVLLVDEVAGYYFYRQDFAVDGAARTTAGILGALQLSELGAGIHAHEKTTPGPIKDRLSLMRTTQTNLEPLWFVSAKPLGLTARLTRATKGSEPEADVTDDASVRHRIFRIPTHFDAEIAEALLTTDVVIADGHHRYQTALTYQAEKRAAEGEGPWDFTLALVHEPVELKPNLLAIHRVAHGVDLEVIVKAMTAEPFFGKPEDLLHWTSSRENAIGLIAQDELFAGRTKERPATAFVESAVSAAHGDLAHAYSLEEIMQGVGQGGLGFIIPAISLQWVLAEALSGRTVPSKTTLFSPKPLTGLVMRPS